MNKNIFSNFTNKKKYKLIFTIIFLFISVAFLFANDATTDFQSKGAKIANWFINIGINPYLVVFLIAMLPIVELRGAIPVGILFLKLQWVYVILFSIIGNILPIFLILFLFGAFEKLARHIPILNKFLDWLFKRTMSKSHKIETYQELGLMFFVSIPLPVTGAWTGSLLAYIMKLKYAKSILFIFLGVLIAAIIVSVLTLLTSMGFNMFSRLLG